MPSFNVLGFASAAFGPEVAALVKQFPTYDLRTIHRVVRFAKSLAASTRLLEFAQQRTIDPNILIDLLNDYGVNQHGFTFGPFTISRVVADQKLHTVCVETAKTRIYLHSSPGGKVTPQFEKVRPA